MAVLSSAPVATLVAAGSEQEDRKEKERNAEPFVRLEPGHSPAFCQES